MLPAVVDVLQLVVNLRLFRLVAGCDELFSKLLQMRFILAEQVDLFHTVLNEEHRQSGQNNYAQVSHLEPQFLRVSHQLVSLQD